MKKLKGYGLLIGLCALTAVVAAQSSVTGNWSGTMQGGRGPQTVNLVLKAEGDKLTGSITGGRGGDVAITDGTISGATLKFKSKQAGRGGEMILNWTGTLKGDEIAFSRTVEGGQGQPQEFVLNRQK